MLWLVDRFVVADEMDEEDRIQSFEIDGTKMEVRPRLSLHL